MEVLTGDLFLDIIIVVVIVILIKFVFLVGALAIAIAGIYFFVKNVLGYALENVLKDWLPVLIRII